MKKIYSFVLMAAMLFVGTNAWGVTIPAASFSDLQEAFNDAHSGDVIQLTGDIVFAPENYAIWLGTEQINGTPKSITLDLAGHSITRQASTASVSKQFFVITHGELFVTNSNSGFDAIIGFEENAACADGSTIFSVYGSYKPTNDASNALINGFFSHLEIGENILLQLPNGCLGTAIAVDVVHNKTTTDNIPYTASNGAIKYMTAILKVKSNNDYGYSYGVQVDVKCDISSMGVANNDNPGETALPKSKTYGIKTNGNMWSPKVGTGAAPTSSINAAFTDMDQTYLNNYVAANHTTDAEYVPFVHVYPSSHITSTNGSQRSAAIYASGYAKWLIEGICTGSIGVSISSGEIDINGATITSNGQQYNKTAGTTGVTGSGSAIVVNSRDNYAGNVEVTLSGNTNVSSEKGYAIEETVHTDNNQNKVEDITLEGAVVTGGDKGAIVIADQTVGETTIIAVDVNGTITKKTDEDATPVEVGTSDYAQMINGTTSDPSKPATYNDDADYNVTPGIDQTSGKPTIVVVPNTSKVVTMNDYGYTTFSANGKSRQIKTTDYANLKAYTATEVSNGELVLTPIAKTDTVVIIPLNTGVIFIGEPNTTYVLDSCAKAGVTAITENWLEPASEWGGSLVDGIYTNVPKDYVYVLVGNELYKYTGEKMKANKAYLQLNQPGPYGAPQRMRMVIAETEEEQQTEAVSNVEEAATVKAVKFMENGKIFIRRGENVYNLQGQIVK